MGFEAAPAASSQSTGLVRTFSPNPIFGLALYGDVS